MIGFADQERRIGPQIVEQAIASREEGLVLPRRSWTLRQRSAMTHVRWGLMVVALLLGAAVSLAVRPDTSHLFDFVRSARAFLW